MEDQLKEKVDCEVFDNEVAALREMIGNMAADEDKPKVQV